LFSSESFAAYEAASVAPIIRRDTPFVTHRTTEYLIERPTILRYNLYLYGSPCSEILLLKGLMKVLEHHNLPAFIHHVLRALPE
jgi:hypothetical protein